MLPGRSHLPLKLFPPRRSPHPPPRREVTTPARRDHLLNLPLLNIGGFDRAIELHPEAISSAPPVLRGPGGRKSWSSIPARLQDDHSRVVVEAYGTHAKSGPVCFVDQFGSRHPPIPQPCEVASVGDLRYSGSLDRSGRCGEASS